MPPCALVRRWAILAAVVALYAACAARAADPAPQPAPPDVLCGPRCAHQVLQHYGHRVDLVEVIREVQWPDMEGGTSLAAMAESLSGRGIHTYALRVPPGAYLDWPWPAIVHCDGRESGGIGHFVVWLPSSTSERCDIWEGLDGAKSYATAEFRQQWTGHVLLTSPEPIDDRAATFAPYDFEARPWLRSLTLTLVGVGLPLLLGAYVHRLMRPRPRAQSGDAHGHADVAMAPSGAATPVPSPSGRGLG